MKNLSINLKGRVQNFYLPKNKSLLPLLEAVVNSIHAIEERRETDENFNEGIINIRILRSKQIPMVTYQADIEGFIVEDDGIGFNEANFDSFLESDTIYKMNKGGKGVGRFSWLKAFEKAEIESVFMNSENILCVRKFAFSLDENEIDDSYEKCSDEMFKQTTVTLSNCLSDYRQSLPKEGKTVAEKILHHCLIYFLVPDCPKINVIDDESFSLNNIYEKTISSEKNKINFTIKDKSFSLLNVKMEDKVLNGNKLFLCANNRVVEEKELEKYIPNLDKKFFDENNFYFMGVLTSEFLDRNVNSNRLSFDIADKGIGIGEDLSIDEIMEKCCERISLFLKTYLDKIQEEKSSRIITYINEEAIQFKPLLKHMKDEVDQIKPYLSDEKLDDELYKIKRKLEKRTKKASNELLKKLESSDIDADYNEMLECQITAICDSNTADLATYVARRKVVLTLLEKGLRRKDDGKFSLESYIHKLIYPIRTDSYDIDDEGHNLWLIDERLAYSRYISSDIPFGGKNTEKRTDILMLDSPVAVANIDASESIYDTIVIFELKRPMRDDYTLSENPISQLYDYADKIQSGKAKDRYGRIIKVSKETRFYLYAICDDTDTLQKIIKNNSFTESIDKLGYYLYNSQYNAHVEILSYNKILQDANRKNKIFFDKLGL